MDWCSGLAYRLGLWLGGGAAGSIPRSAFVSCGGENVCVHSCVWVLLHVCTALLAFIQLSSITEVFKLCWRTGQKFTLNPSFLHHPATECPVDLQLVEGHGNLDSQLPTCPVLFFFIILFIQEFFFFQTYTKLEINFHTNRSHTHARFNLWCSHVRFQVPMDSAVNKLSVLRLFT